MEVLSKDKKKVYEEFIKLIQWVQIDVENLKAPEDWLIEIKDLKIDKKLKND